ncbi:hypothetical protein [Nocardia sp. NPDC060259]|uniref:hypothetical protein n=1 Tax=Nocardia sp. NPDC060259 TaxID=3347088 RepID=UPI0036606E61
MPAYTPKYQIPYPLPTEPIADGAATIGALAGRVDDVLNALSVPPASSLPAAAVSRSSAVSVANAADAVVSWNATDWDTLPGGQIQANATGLTVRAPGLYLVEAMWPWAANANGRRALKVTLNNTGSAGTVLARAESANSWDNIGQVSGVLNLAAGNVLRLLVTQDSGGALNGGGTMWGGAVRGRFKMTYLRAAP